MFFPSLIFPRITVKYALYERDKRFTIIVLEEKYIAEIILLKCLIFFWGNT